MLSVLAFGWLNETVPFTTVAPDGLACAPLDRNNDKNNPHVADFVTFTKFMTNCISMLQHSKDDTFVRVGYQVPVVTLISALTRHHMFRILKA
jgi:hypothetical protein